MAESARVFAPRTRHVWLRVGPADWSRWSPGLRALLLKGLAKVAEIRGELAGSATVSSVPPVEVVAECWWDDDRQVDGRAIPLGGPEGLTFGVQLPAQAAVCEDSRAVRAILVHEFLHCFHLIANLVNSFDEHPAGSLVIDDHYEPTDAVEDNARLARPDFWFPGQTAPEVLRHNDPRAPDMDASQFLVMRYLPRVMPDHRYEVRGTFGFPHEVVNRIRELRNGGSPEAPGAGLPY